MNTTNSDIFHTLCHNAAVLLHNVSGTTVSDIFLSQDISNTFVGLDKLRVSFDTATEELQSAILHTLEQSLHLLNAQSIANVIYS